VICAHAYTWRKNGVAKEAIDLQWAFRSASCDFKPGKKRWAGALLSEKCCCFVRKASWRVTQIWTSPKKEKHFGRLATFWLGTFAMLFSAIGCVVRHENTRRWTVGSYNGCLRDFEKFVCISIRILRVRASSSKFQCTDKASGTQHSKARKDDGWEDGWVPKADM